MGVALVHLSIQIANYKSVMFACWICIFVTRQTVLKCFNQESSCYLCLLTLLLIHSSTSILATVCGTAWHFVQQPLKKAQYSCKTHLFIIAVNITPITAFIYALIAIWFKYVGTSFFSNGWFPYIIIHSEHKLNELPNQVYHHDDKLQVIMALTRYNFDRL